jgi:hypothetical protein
VDNFCQRRDFFPLEKFLKPLRWLNPANFRLAENGNRIHGDWLTAAHCPQGSVLKNALGVSLIFRKHGSIDVMKMAKKWSVKKQKEKERKGKKKKGLNLELSNFIVTRRRTAEIDKSDNYLTPEPAACNLETFSAQ